VWENGGTVPRILKLGTRWRWVVSFTARPLYPRGECSPWIGGWVGSRAGLNMAEKRKIILMMMFFLLFKVVVVVVV